MTDRIGVQFTYPATATLPSYTDTLWYDPADYPPNVLEHEAEKQARYAAWKKLVTAPQPEPEPVAPQEAAQSALDAARDALVQAQVAVDAAAAVVEASGD